MDKDNKISLLMKPLTEFYKEQKYIDEIKMIVNQESIVSLRILDWFITNYSKKIKTVVSNTGGGGKENIDVYTNYKLMLKAFSKKIFDPFCRKNKMIFYYGTNDTEFIETSCGQLCFFKWCFENGIIEFVKNNLTIIENDMKNSLKSKKENPDQQKKRQPLSVLACRSISKQHIKYTVKFD